MYGIEEFLTQQQITEFFLEDPALCYLGLPDFQLYNLYEHKTYAMEPLTQYLGVHLNNELVLVLNYTYFTDICINIHPYLKSKYQNTPMWGEIQQYLREYFITNTQVKKVIVMTPKPCKHVHKTCRKYGFKPEGRVLNSVIWRGKVTDILIYGLALE